jgi:hypothetical protein
MNQSTTENAIGLCSLSSERITRFAIELAKTAPPISTEQRDRLAVLLQPLGGGRIAK